GDAWIERPVAEGVWWRARRHVDRHGPQVVHDLVIDPTQRDLEIRAIAASGCQTVGELGASVGAIAGVNGGYFGSGCAPVSLLIESGELVGTNSRTRGAFGLNAAGTPLIDVIAASAGWPEAYQAHGGGPVLVTAGTAHEGAERWAEEGFTGGFIGKNPR